MEVMTMANLIRHNSNREMGRERGQGGQEYAWDPFRMMDALLRWDPFRSGLGDGGGFTPAFDVKETKDAYVVRADLPGVRESDVDVSVTGNVVTVSGRREQENREEGDQFFALERSYGTFMRTLTLPEGADVENIKAELKEGVLALTIPKRPEVQPRRISIGGQSKLSAGTATNERTDKPARG
jgi:HSP20 family protein